MLFDERELRVFDNPDSRVYFEEILQLYYSKNYRAAVTLLYSFVTYDLFNKLQYMADDGDKHAKQTLTEIKKEIDADGWLPGIEKDVLKFFQENCNLYFNNFSGDIEYLKDCRHKCAHLKINDSRLYVPEDYQVRMLICSMYDNILSVKAPFIFNLFDIAKQDIERYSLSNFKITYFDFDDNIKQKIIEKYLNRMTKDAIKKSYKSFIHVLFIAEGEEPINNLIGLYIFAFSITDFVINKGYSDIMQEQNISDTFKKISIDSLSRCSLRKDALVSLMVNFPVILDTIKSNETFYNNIIEETLSDPKNLGLYRIFFPRNSKSTYEYFKETPSIQVCREISSIYKAVKDCEDFNLVDFLFFMIERVPKNDGFNQADAFTKFFINHMNEIDINDVISLMNIYENNNQFTKRNKHFGDIQVIDKYLRDNNIDI